MAPGKILFRGHPVEDLPVAVEAGLGAWRAKSGKIVSGFGRRLRNPVDPRALRLMALVRAAAADGTVSSCYAEIARRFRRI